MNWRFAIAQRFRAGAGEHGLDFGNKSEGNLLRRLRAEIETGWRENLGVDRNAAVQNCIQQLIAALPRTEEADVGQIELKQMAKRG